MQGPICQPDLLPEDALLLVAVWDQEYCGETTDTGPALELSTLAALLCYQLHFCSDPKHIKSDYLALDARVNGIAVPLELFEDQ